MEDLANLRARASAIHATDHTGEDGLGGIQDSISQLPLFFTPLWGPRMQPCAISHKVPLLVRLMTDIGMIVRRRSKLKSFDKLWM
jgi:hypothetical protein